MRVRASACGRHCARCSAPHPYQPTHPGPTPPPLSRYDGTVRNAVGEVIQFLYGEDGMEGTAIEGQRIDFLRWNRRKFVGGWRLPRSSTPLGSSVDGRSRCRGGLQKLWRRGSFRTSGVLLACLAMPSQRPHLLHPLPPPLLCL